ncbi:hypothetical protein [Cutibacterium phage PAVL21]|nr:hypothetical protein [Cutibacterium phage PAVL21]
MAGVQNMPFVTWMPCCSSMYRYVCSCILSAGRRPVLRSRMKVSPVSVLVKMRSM